MEAMLRDRLARCIEHLTHVLPAQAPIRDFVHHNTLHGFQHLPFAEALTAAHHLTGAATYWPPARFRAEFAAGRITPADLDAALTELLPDAAADIAGSLSRRDVLRASLLMPDDDPGLAGLAWQQRERPLPDDVFLETARHLLAPRSAVETVDWRGAARQRWLALCDEVGRQRTLRSLLETISGEDVLEKVRGILQRHLAAHLDLGVAAWRNPLRERGFFAAWRASAALDMFWELDELPNVRDEIMHLPDDPLAVLAEELPRLLPDERLWPGYLQHLALELPGWSGMFLWRDRHPEKGDGTPVAMLDFLAARVLLERLLCAELIGRLTGAPMNFGELRAYYADHPAEFFVRDALRRMTLPEELQHRVAHRVAAGPCRDLAEWEGLAASVAASQRGDGAADCRRLAGLLRQLALTEAQRAVLTTADAEALLACAAELSPLQRGQVWLQAYEHHYREQLFAALVANRSRQTPSRTVAAQVVMCMDDREEGTRRHLEELAPDVETYGAAGFFGVVMAWQGMDDAVPTALCPVGVTPRHLVRERPAPGGERQAWRRAARRASRLGWRRRLYQMTRRSPLGGPLMTALAAAPALLALGAATLFPGWFGRTQRRWREQFDGRVAGVPELSASGAHAGDRQLGFSDEEQVERVAAFLRMIGLTDGFAPLVLMLGHGSSSENNPHASAYDCGACAGRHGGPNARVFAAMANRPSVRAGLAARGIPIPPATWFVAAEHNTCDDTVDWYDLEQVPSALQPALDRLLGQLAEACRAHAAERCRRLASAPPRPTPWRARQHVAGRASDISQARPELGHANNAAAFIGRRQATRGLFLDRRVFLISYDPLHDADGAVVEGILLAAGPVGAGIALEYYFSSVDNERFGCGSKVTHNLTGLFGVMEGADSDLRTGLPWQMVEIHEPMRLLVVVEQTPAVLDAVIARQPALQELVGNAWILLASCDPLDGAIHYRQPGRGWQPWAGRVVLPRVARSADWFTGESGPLAPALLLGGVA